MIPIELADLRERMLAALHDCGGGDVERLRARLMRIASVQELWHTRCEVFRLVSRAHCESVAAQRITMSAAARP